MGSAGGGREQAGRRRDHRHHVGHRRERRPRAAICAGVDIHGVHNWTDERAAPLLAPRYEKAPDVQRALDVAWKSSPVSAIKGWRSPVLLIHGDDDRNVRFNQTVDLVQRLAKQHVDFEELIIPDDTHHFMRHANWVTVDSATAAYFERKFGGSGAKAAAEKR